MAGQSWPGQEVTQPTQGPAAVAPPLRQIVAPQAAIPTPQAPVVEANTRTNTERTNQTITQGDTNGHNFTDENSLRSQYRGDPRIQGYETILPLYRAAQTAADTPAGDYNVVTAFAKITDPSTGIREAESQNVEGTATPDQRVQGLWNFYTQGRGRLTAETRSQLMAELAQRGRAWNRLYNTARADVIHDAERYGFEPQAIVGTHAAIPFRRELGLDRPQGQDRGELTFWDDPARSPPPGAEAFQRDIEARLRSGAFTTPEQIVDFANNYTSPDGEHHHFDIPLSQARAAINAHGRISVRPPAWAPLEGNPDSSAEQAGAAVRGATDAATAGLDHPAAAAFNTFAPEWAGATGGTFRENLARENSYDHYNRENHPYATLGGEVAGSLAVPLRSGAEGAARAAAAEVLAGGGSRFEAVAAARTAASLQLGREGAVYGGIHGAATSDGDPAHVIANAAVETVMGYGTGRGLGRFAVPRERAPSDLPPLVDPVTGRLNQPLESAAPAQRMAAAAEHKINLPLGAATDRGGAIIEKGLDILPASAGLMNDARRGTEGEVTDALERVAGRYGASQTLDDAGQALQRGARNWVSRFDEVSSRAYDAIPISPEAPARLDNTRSALASMVDVFRSNPTLRSVFQNGRLKRYLEALTPPPATADEFGQRDPMAGVLRTTSRPAGVDRGQLNWQDLKHFRSIIGEEIGAERFSDSPARSQLRRLYASLSEDMRETATAQGPRAIRGFERANNLYREGQERIDGALVRLLGDDSKNNPENAAAALQTIVRSGRGSSNIGQLAAMRSSMAGRHGAEWDEAASQMIRLMGQPARGEGRAFNPQTFVQNYADMTEPARNIMFGDGSRKELREALDSFIAVNQRLAGTSALRNTSQSATGLTAAGTVGTIISSLMSPVLGAKALAAGALNYGAGRLWTHAPFVRWATGYTRMMNGAARAGTEPTAENLVRQRLYLRRLIQKTPAIADAATELDQRLFGQPESH